MVFFLSASKITSEIQTESSSLSRPVADESIGQTVLQFGLAGPLSDQQLFLDGLVIQNHQLKIIFVRGVIIYNGLLNNFFSLLILEVHAGPAPPLVCLQWIDDPHGGDLFIRLDPGGLLRRDQML